MPIASLLQTHKSCENLPFQTTMTFNRKSTTITLLSNFNRPWCGWPWAARPRDAAYNSVGMYLSDGAYRCITWDPDRNFFAIKVGFHKLDVTWWGNGERLCTYAEENCGNSEEGDKCARTAHSVFCSFQTCDILNKLLPS